MCDVFTDRPLAGNQLAVFTDARGIPERQLQALARELALSETAFVYPAEAGGHARLRIFTPAAELRFAGHPCLGAAFVLAGPMQLSEIVLELPAGLVPVRLEREGPRLVFGTMAQPVPAVELYPHADRLLAALGVPRSELPVEVYDNGVRHAYVCLPAPADVAAVRPDLGGIAELPAVLGVSCFARSSSGWKTRMFAPALGVPEDPATGSAAGPLAAHLVRHGAVASGEEVVISQGEEVRRPATLHATAWVSANGIERVEVGGSAVVVARGAFRLDRM